MQRNKIVKYKLLKSKFRPGDALSIDSKRLEVVLSTNRLLFAKELSMHSGILLVPD